MQTCEQVKQTYINRQHNHSCIIENTKEIYLLLPHTNINNLGIDASRSCGNHYNRWFYSLNYSWKWKSDYKKRRPLLDLTNFPVTRGGEAGGCDVLCVARRKRLGLAWGSRRLLWVNVVVGTCRCMEEW